MKEVKSKTQSKIIIPLLMFPLWILSSILPHIVAVKFYIIYIDSAYYGDRVIFLYDSNKDNALKKFKLSNRHDYKFRRDPAQPIRIMTEKEFKEYKFFYIFCQNNMNEIFYPILAKTQPEAVQIFKQRHQGKIINKTFTQKNFDAWLANKDKPVKKEPVKPKKPVKIKTWVASAEPYAA